MKEQDFRFLRSVFAEYYSGFSREVYVPPPVSSREIGFSVGLERVMVRHLSFPSLSEIREHIVNSTPWDAYHSCAVYESPEKPMGYKGEMWVDLAFDIDAKEVEPGCVKETTYWVCNKCGLHGKGKKKSCAQCSQGTQLVDFINPRCISITAQHTGRLCSALIDEIGVDPSNIFVYFSGHMGFHVYAASKDLGELGADARREIVSYLALEGVTDRHLLTATGRVKRIRASGIGRRVLSELLNIVATPSENRDVLGDDGADIIERNARKVLPSLEKGVLDDLIRVLGPKRSSKLLKQAWKRAAIVVDPSVTTDVHRMFRMPGTLNSKSGLPKHLVRLDQVHGVTLSMLPEYGRAEVKVSVTFAPRMRIGDYEVGPLSNEAVTVPRYIAAYLVLKGVASVG